jgi:hypothetical protein
MVSFAYINDHPSYRRHHSQGIASQNETNPPGVGPSRHGDLGPRRNLEHPQSLTPGTNSRQETRSGKTSWERVPPYANVAELPAKPPPPYPTHRVYPPAHLPRPAHPRYTRREDLGPRRNLEHPQSLTPGTNSRQETRSGETSWERVQPYADVAELPANPPNPPPPYPTHPAYPPTHLPRPAPYPETRQTNKRSSYLAPEVCIPNPGLTERQKTWDNERSSYLAPEVCIPNTHPGRTEQKVSDRHIPRWRPPMRQIQRLQPRYHLRECAEDSWIHSASLRPHEAGKFPRALHCK